MPKMKWTKPSAETIAYFERIAPGPPIQARRMFGMPARFLNGHMLVGVFGNTFMLHLSDVDREACIRAGAKPFAPMGREAKEYVDVAPGTFDDRTLKEWIVRGMRYLGSLPPKLKKKRGKPAPERRSQRGSAPPSRIPVSTGTPSTVRSSAARRSQKITAATLPVRTAAARAARKSAPKRAPASASTTSRRGVSRPASGKVARSRNKSRRGG
jgi:TfoX/Sxy family transcriptional regulator of competence genes